MSVKVGYTESSLPGGVISVAINAAGSGYSATEQVMITGGDDACTLTIDSVNGSGGVTSVSIWRMGSTYSNATNVATTYFGAGTGFTVDTTTNTNTTPYDIEVTGLGFAPKAVFLLCTTNSLDLPANNLIALTTNEGDFSRGAIVQNGQFVESTHGSQDTGDWSITRNEDYCIEHADGNIGKYFSASGTLDSDGFTLTVDTDLPNFSGYGYNYIINYIAIGGEDMKTYMQELEIPYPVTDGVLLNRYFNTGHVFDLLWIMASGAQVTGDHEGTGTPSITNCLMAATADAGNHGVTYGHNCASWGYGDPSQSLFFKGIRISNILGRFISGKDTLNSLNASSISGQGFTSTLLSTSTAPQFTHAASIKGVEAKIVQISTPTSGTLPVSQSTTTVGFQPEGVMFFTTGINGTPGINTNMGHHIGFTDGTNNVVSGIGGERISDGLGGFTHLGTTSSHTGYCIWDYIGPVVASTCQATCTSLDSSGFTLSYDKIDTTAHTVLCLAWKTKDEKGTKATSTLITKP